MSDFQTEPFSRPSASTGYVAAASFPPPPKLHWGLLLSFTILTLGIFMVVWLFIQSSWAKKIDPESNATTQFIGYLALAVVGQVLVEFSTDGLKAVGLMLTIGSYIVFYFGAYSIRRTMLEHYNKVEPMQLKLSAAIVFFFSCFYLQYHMTRIARWKDGGSLAA